MKKIESRKYNLSSGFSTVELLITLFVASVFLFSGYQLYSMIIKDGGETRAQARASNAAYEYLQEYKADANYIKTICEEPITQPMNEKDITVSGLSKPKLTVNITCPYDETPSITKVEVILKYGNDKSVTQATYVNKE